MPDEVFTPVIWFDLNSAGSGRPTKMEAKDVCKMWNDGFTYLDAVHHQAGYYLISVKDKEADILGYAMATHFKKKQQKGIPAHSLAAMI